MEVKFTKIQKLPFYYYMKCADMEHLTFINVRTAICCFKGQDVIKDEKEAVSYFETSATKGCLSSMEMLGIILCNCKSRLYDPNGDVDSISHYAVMRYSDDNIKENKQLASVLYKKAADHDLPEDLHNYGKMCEIGNGIPVDKKEAEKYLQIYKFTQESDTSVSKCGFL